VVQVVERNLKNKLSRVISEADFRATGGVTFLVKMLNQVDRGVQKTIFEALDGTNPKLVEEIRAKGIRDENVLRAMNAVPRHLFMDNSFMGFAYVDKAFPISAGQTISQPYTVAFQTEALQIKRFEKVLEVVQYRRWRL